MFYKIPCGLALWPSGGIGRLRLLPKAGDAKAALPRKSDGGGAPSLPWEERARCRADLVRQHLVKKGRDAAPSGSQASGNGVAVFGCKGGVAAQVGRRRRAIPTLGGTSALPLSGVT